MFRFGLVALLVFTAWGATAEATVPFHKGVNLTGWFQSASVDDLPLLQFGPDDFRQLRELGVDGVRLPVNFLAYTNGDSLDPKFLRFLDQAVDGLLGAGLSVVLDNHSDPLDPRVRFRLEGFLTRLWTQLAARYRDRPASLVYELQNEPHEIRPQQWDEVQHRVLAALRGIDQAHLVVVTGADWGSAPALSSLSTYDDPRLVYSFHCYDPFRFTHQGAAWAGQAGLSGVRFPLPGDEAALARTLDAVVAFGRARGVPVWCGEFGVYNLKADPGDRVRWYQTFRTLLEQRSLSWTMWDYRDSFGLFVKGSAEVFEQDLNLPLVAALGFTVPAQSAPGPRVHTSGFTLYHDGWSAGLRQAGYHRQGVIDVYDGREPQSGLTSLRLSSVERYAGAAALFAPWKDLTALAPTAKLSLWMRSTAKRFSIDLRFVDGAVAGENGLPWRLSVTVDQTRVPGDGQWHRLEVPLAEFADIGAWDGSWHPPHPGAFEWNRVARFEIVAEGAALDGDLGFDEVAITTL